MHLVDEETTKGLMLIAKLHCSVQLSLFVTFSRVTRLQLMLRVLERTLKLMWRKLFSSEVAILMTTLSSHAT